MAGLAPYYYQLAVSSQIKVPNAHGGILSNRRLPNTITPLPKRFPRKLTSCFSSGAHVMLSTGDECALPTDTMSPLFSSQTWRVRVCQARVWGERASVGTFMEQSSHPTAMYLNNAPNNQNTLDGRQESTRRRRALYLPLGLMRTQLSF